MARVDRLEFIDVTKGVAIFLVVLGHISVQNKMVAFIYSFHLPLFFFISGLFFKPHKYDTFRLFISAKARSLYLPYLTLYVLSYVYWILIEHRQANGVDLKPIIGLFYGTDNGYMYPNGALWFLPALLSAETGLFLIVRYLKSRLNILIALFACVGIAYFISVYRPHPLLPLSINSAFMAVPFIGIGYMLNQYVKTVQRMKGGYKILISLILFLFAYIIQNLNGRIDMDYIVYHNPVYFIISAFLGIGGLLLFSGLIENIYALRFLGINSLLLMGLQFPIIRGLFFISHNLLNLSEVFIRSSVLLSFIYSFMVIVVATPIIFLFNRYLFVLIGKTRR